MQLEQVVPWGRSLKEYQAMFNLSPTDLNKTLLGCSDGPASFNAEMTKLGKKVVSVDPVYQFSHTQIKARIDEIAPVIIKEVERNKQQFNWHVYPNVDALYQARLTAMNIFLADYDLGKRQQRYQTGSLPKLDFTDKQFDLALCSHFLFLYSALFDQNFHIKAVQNLCQIAKEIRIYPLVGLDNTPSPHLDAVINSLNSAGHQSQLIPVDYVFQQGATQMLQITAQ